MRIQCHLGPSPPPARLGGGAGKSFRKSDRQGIVSVAFAGGGGGFDMVVAAPVRMHRVPVVVAFAVTIAVVVAVTAGRVTVVAVIDAAVVISVVVTVAVVVVAGNAVVSVAVILATVTVAVVAVAGNATNVFRTTTARILDTTITTSIVDITVVKN